MDSANNKKVADEAAKANAAVVGKALASTPKTGELPAGKSKPATKPAATPAPAVSTKKRISHLQLVPDMLAKGASEAEIAKALRASFTSRGNTDTEWVNGRIKIYLAIGQKTYAKRLEAAKAKKAKAS